MTARRDRLKRLLAVRNIRLAMTARALGTATAAAAATAVTAARLGALRAEFRGHQGPVAGYAMKAAAATQATLVTAEANTRLRLVEASARRALIEGDFRRQRAGVDAVVRAAERAVVDAVAGDRQ